MPTTPDENVRQVHETVTHWGDWHVFAVCRTCFWEGTRTNEYHAGRQQADDERAHKALMGRKYRRARMWRWLTRRRPVTHLVPVASGRTLVCCDQWPTDVGGLDRFTFTADEATCGGGR